MQSDVFFKKSNFFKPDLIINTVALTDVDFCEKNPDLALQTLIGSWSDHYNSWTKNNKRLLLIKYEDLLSNKKKELWQD